MHKCEDYYRILQVHYLAEPEVIESAYRRLEKKYHPDVNKDENSAETMKKINQAYEELINPVKRQQYNLEWEDKYSELVQLKLNIGDSDGDSTPPEFRKWNSTL